MKLVFYSVVLNQHQAPLADAFHELLGEEYTFVETTDLRDYKGSTVDYSKRSYLLRAWETEEGKRKAMELALTADCCVFSGFEAMQFQKARIKRGLLSFDMSERWLKKGILNLFSPTIRKMFLAYHLGGWARRPMYKLCSSGFAAADQRKLFTYRNRCYKWGYFTAVDAVAGCEKMPVEASQDVPTSRIAPTIMWCARFLKWKHPELSVLMAERLKQKGYDFVLDFYGSGDEEGPTKALVADKSLQDRIKFHGNIPNDQVLAAMAQHDIFLFTSDSNEGWGAVANESMSQGCVLVGSDAIGSIPFLVKHRENGLIFKSCDVDSLTEQVEWVMTHPAEMREIQQAAVDTMQNVWSPKNAAHNFLQLVNDLQNCRDCSVLQGPGSKDF